MEQQLATAAICGGQRVRCTCGGAGPFARILPFWGGACAGLKLAGTALWTVFLSS
jgi:hypothetical protein